VSWSKGEISESQILRRWPHHVALPAKAVLGTKKSMAMYGLAKTLSKAPRPCHLSRDSAELVVFCFAKREDAQEFAHRFGGELLNCSSNICDIGCQ
jgi:hypothetical protein